MSDQDSIRERAYYWWEKEGRPSGRADDHWIMAELSARAETIEVTIGSPNAGKSTGAGLKRKAAPKKQSRPAEKSARLAKTKKSAPSHMPH